ncbi:uncharacterized protein LOC126320765 [Schistocerca gregaria]|uniref:uncharacterized protein LOC126320765 n=1 Tax=Schistocerca gregaria TaxID=7010 RepID=UPI00211DFA7F|nr:uncharacterized protein LOC126320765 [Schistocerca gregaria]
MRGRRPGAALMLRWWAVIFLCLSAALAVHLHIRLAMPEAVEDVLLALETRGVRLSPKYQKKLWLEDLDGGVNSFFHAGDPETYSYQVALNESLELGWRDYKYWMRYLNEGTEIRVGISWDHGGPLRFRVLRVESASGFDGSAWPDFGGREVLEVEGVSRIEVSWRAPRGGHYVFAVWSVANEKAGVPWQPREEVFRVVAVEFEFWLVQYDISGAYDRFLGSFYKTLNASLDDWVVFVNPESDRVLRIRYQVAPRREKFVGAFLLYQGLLGCGLALCYAAEQHPEPREDEREKVGAMGDKEEQAVGRELSSEEEEARECARYDFEI